jgi:hypothetical protein
MLQYDWKAIVEKVELTLQPLFIMPLYEITENDINVEAHRGFDAAPVNLTSYLKNVFDITLEQEVN